MAEDGVGKGNEAAQQFSVAADMIPPTVIITGPTTIQAGAFDITITFSEDVTDFIADDIAVGNGSVTAFSGSGDNLQSHHHTNNKWNSDRRYT